VTATLSAETVPLGNTFELRVTVPVPPASAVYFPDELPGTGLIESHGRVSFKAQAAGDGATLTLTYPLIAFGTGNIEVPGLEVRIGPVNEAVGGAALPGGSVVGARQTSPGSGLLASIAPREVHVASLFELEGVLAGVGPMPAADVVGHDWNLPSLGLMFAFSAVLLGGLVATIRRSLLSRSAGAAAVLTNSTLEDARRAALQELDGLLVRGLHTNGRVREFYTLTSEIVRRYAERLDPRCGPDLTGTELLQRLEARGNGVRVEGLAVEMRCAEVVKFGRLRPETDAAEAHWRAIRKWVDEAGEWDS
jgi:hypothetical protein